MMKSLLAIAAALGLTLSAMAAIAAPAKFKDCPLLGPMSGYHAEHAPEWRNWDAQTVHVDDGKGGDSEATVLGAVCLQEYSEDQGKTDGSVLEISENYKQAMRGLGAEIKRDFTGNMVARLVKDGKETWFVANATRDDGYSITEIAVEPFKKSLLPPSGNDYRLVGHMPGYTADKPTTKNFDEYKFPTADGELAIRGKLFRVNYNEPAKQPERKVTLVEVMENYRQALKALGAEFLRDDGVNAENITARLDDHGQMVYLFIQANAVTAVEERPFQMSVQPPTADAMKTQLDKDGHIALYVNFDFSKATLKPDAAPVIAQIVALLKNNPALKIEIDGHTDSIGGHDYNMKLSQDRAASVAVAVKTGGIDPARLASAGFGPDKPIAPNDTDEGRAKNRRVELVKAQ